MSRTFLVAVLALTSSLPAAEPQKLIFDTDLGNDVDDAMALALIHSLQRRGHCELLAVTLTNGHPNAAKFVDAVNTYYGYGATPIGGAVNGWKTASKYVDLVDEMKDGKPVYPYDVDPAKLTDSVTLLRKTLAAQPDGSVAVAQVGFSPNLARLLDTPGDDISPLTGRELVAKKVTVLSIMAGAFETIDNNNHYLEYNVIKDIPACQKLAKDWPTPIAWSGFEVGIAVPYPAVSIEQDYVYQPGHIIEMAYRLYQPPPHNRPTWDLTSVLYAVFPERGYFGLSKPGVVTIEDDGFSRFAPKADGKNRYLTVNSEQRARVVECFVQLCSEPPHTNR